MIDNSFYASAKVTSFERAASERRSRIARELQILDARERRAKGTSPARSGVRSLRFRLWARVRPGSDAASGCADC